MYPLDDTIAAIASPPVGASRGIVRLSGPEVVPCLREWFDGDVAWQDSAAAQVFPGRFRLDALRWLPGSLYLWPTDRSYTRQPTAELHTIGSPPLLQYLLDNVCRSGARLALPGEFTLRAFLAGRMDLTQAEAVLGVIDAESERQLSVALDQLAGGVSHRMHALRSDLLDLLADIEAGLDFVEEDIEFVTTEQAVVRLNTARMAVLESERQMQSRDTQSLIPRIALVGSANVGKSSLLNALAADHIAIVSPAAGTTRDNVTAIVRLAGLECELVDTAGRESGHSSSPEAEAQRHSLRAADNATMQILCLDCTRAPTAQESEMITQLRQGTDLLVATKSDQPCRLETEVDVSTSSYSGEGLTELVQRIELALVRDQRESGEAVSATAARCRASLRSCGERLEHASLLSYDRQGDELVAAEIRGALDDLGQVVGVVYTDDVLDRIFSRFCIGK